MSSEGNDGYRGRVIRDGVEVRLLTEAGLNWTWHSPAIVDAARKIKTKQFMTVRPRPVRARLPTGGHKPSKCKAVFVPKRRNAVNGQEPPAAQLL
jgi:hypothetical protein